MTAPSLGAVLDHEVGETGLLAVRLHSSDLRIRAVDGPTVRVFDPTGTLDRSVVVERAPGSLSIRADRGVNVGIGPLSVQTGFQAPDLDIEVPRRATVVIETASGDVEIFGLAGDQRYRTASGDLVLRDVRGRVTLDAVSGGVHVGLAGTGDVTVRTVSGDLVIRGDAIDAMRVATTSGDIRIDGRLTGTGPFGIETVSGDTILGLAGNLRISLKSVTGDLISEVDSVSDGGRGSRSLVIGQGGPGLTVRSISGDVRIVRPSAAPTPSTLAEGTTSMDQTEQHPTEQHPAPAPAAPSVDPSLATDPSLAILEALERGEIDVDEASRRLAALDGDVASSADATVRTERPA